MCDHPGTDCSTPVEEYKNTELWCSNIIEVNVTAPDRSCQYLQVILM